MKMKIIVGLVASIFSQVSLGRSIIINNQEMANNLSGSGNHYDQSLVVTGKDVLLELTESSIVEKGQEIGLSVIDGAEAVLKNTNIVANGLQAINVGIAKPDNAPIDTVLLPSKVSMEGGSIQFDPKGIHDLEPAHAINVEKGSEISLNKVVINTGAETDTVVYLKQDAKANLNEVKIKHTGTQAGFFIGGAGASLSMVNSEFEKVGGHSAVIDARSGTTVDIVGSHIKTDGPGIVAGDAVLNIKGGRDQTQRTSIKTSGWAGGFDLVDSKVNIENTDIETIGEIADGIVMQLGGDLVLKNSSVTVSGENAIAVFLNRLDLNKSQVSFEDSALTSAKAATLVLWSLKGNLGFAGGSIINNSAGEAISIADNTSPLTLNFSRGAVIAGDIVSLSAGNVLNFASSNLSGGVKDIHTATFDQDSTWHVTKDSNLTGTLTNNGSIVFDTSNSTFATLSVGGNLDGNGHYLVNTDLANLNSDFIKVTGQVTGANTVTVKDSGKEPSADGQNKQIISAGGDNVGKGSFILTNKGAVVNAGIYQYELRQDQVSADGSTGWSLVNTGRISDQGGASVNQGGIALTQGLWVEQMNNLRKRLGDLRWTPEANGFWARTYGSEVKFDEGQFGQASQKVHGVALGYDRQFKLSKGKFFAGLRLDHAHADQDLGINSSGEVKANDIAAYFTYLADGGFYTDVLLSRSRRDNSMSVVQTDGSRSEARYREYTRGLSVEMGKYIELSNDWFVEPQVELSHFHLDAHSYTASNGLEVSFGRGHSLTARAGALLGKSYEVGASRGQWYLKGGVKSELNADRDITLNGTQKSVSDRGSSYYAGFGINQIFQRNHMIYMSFEYEKGKHFQRPWSYSVGFRKSW